eukprot:jgi/Botrbrau1/9772/Bobra.85_1s0017.4
MPSVDVGNQAVMCGYIGLGHDHSCNYQKGQWRLLRQESSPLSTISSGPLRAAAAGWGHVLTATVDGKVLETDHAVAPIASSQRYSCGTMHEWPVPLSDKLPRPQREVVQQDLSGLCPAVSTRGDHGSHAGPQLRQGDSQPLPIGPSGGSSPPVHDPSPQGTRPSTGTPEGLTRTSEPELPSSSPSFQGAPCEPCDGDFQAPQPRDREYGRQREEEGRPRNVWCRIPFPPGLRVVAVAAGELHSLCLSEEGSVWAWGSNGEGQLGTDSRVSSGEASSATLQISPRCVLGPLAAEVDRQAPVRSIACGARHNLALMRDGQVYCWGWALHGQCGPGPSETAAVQHKAVQNEAVQHEAIHSYIVDNFLETEEGARLCGTPLRGVGDEGEGHEPERKRAKVNGGTVRYESASQPLPCMPVPCCVAQLSGLDVCGVAAGLAHSAVCTESGAEQLPASTGGGSPAGPGAYCEGVLWGEAHACPDAEREGLCLGLGRLRAAGAPARHHFLPHPEPGTRSRTASAYQFSPLWRSRYTGLRKTSF